MSACGIWGEKAMFAEARFAVSALDKKAVKHDIVRVASPALSPEVSTGPITPAPFAHAILSIFAGSYTRVL